MKRSLQLGMATLGAAVMTLALAGPAMAFPIYEDANYGGYAYQAVWASKQGLGTINNKGSSIGGSPGKTFYENINLTGRSVYLRGNVPDLGAINTNLPWPANWNDRIMSYR